MKRIFLTFLIVLSSVFAFAGVSYDTATKTLTVSGSINSGDISRYSDAITLIVEDAQALNNMANQYGQTLTNLENLILPISITSIPNQTFKNCKKLVDVNWEDLVNLKTIGEEAFMACAIGPTFYVPNSVEEIKKGAFSMCDNIKTLIFDEQSQIQHIYADAFKQSESAAGKLSDVYVNVTPSREIICDNNAFDKYHTCGQTNVATVTTRLHYPSDRFEYYVGTYKSELYDQNYDVKDDNGNWVIVNGQRVHSYGIVTQSIIDHAYSGAENGWQQFFSSGIPVGKESLYRTFSDNVAYKVPYTSEFQIYLVVDYDKENNVTHCIQMNYHDIIPANTGVIVHSNVEGTVFLEYVKNPHITEPYNNEAAPDNLYHYKGTEYYTNYLKPINGVLHIDNVEIINGKKTYRNYFFNKGTTAASRPGPDWKAEYAALGWGFFRSVSKDYRVFNKAFLHLPASMTEASSERLNDDGTLPQDNAQAGAKESFGIYIINGDDMLITNDISSTQETTSDIKNITYNKDNSYYTLQGIRVNNPTRGIYIKNNKKIIIK